MTLRAASPPNLASPSVPLAQFRELQLELEQLHARHVELQRMHASTNQALGHARGEIQGASAHVRELTHRLEDANARLHAANAYQPPPPREALP